MFNPIRSGASHGATGRQGSIPDPLFPIPGSETFWGSTISEENTIDTRGTGTGPNNSGREDISRQASHATVASQSGMVSYRSNCDSPARSRNDCGGRPDLTIQTAQAPPAPFFGMVTSVESSGMIAEQPHHGLCSGESSSGSDRGGNGTAGSVRGIMVTKEVIVSEEGMCTPRPINPGLPPTDPWGWGDFHHGY